MWFAVHRSWFVVISSSSYFSQAWWSFSWVSSDEAAAVCWQTPAFSMIKIIIMWYKISSKMSRPSSITSQSPASTPKLWPFNCPKLGFSLYKSKSFRPVLIRLGEYVSGHNISTKFYNLPNPMALLNYGLWIVKILGFRSLSQIVFIRSLSNLVNILVGIISRPSSITCQIPQALLNYGPWIVQKTELVVSARQLEYPAHQNVVITIEFTTNTTSVFWVSLAL